MVIAVTGGKGGTGKTTVACALAMTAARCQFIDCDAEAPNAHLFLKPTIRQRQPVSVLRPVVDSHRCTLCGKCAEFCEFNAIAVVADKLLIFHELCHFCGGCVAICPTGAIQEEPLEIGVVECGDAAPAITFVQAKLTVGEQRAGVVIEAAKRLIDSDQLVIVDAPPGNAGAMIEAVLNADYCILVTEPTPFGLHDLKMCIDVIRFLKMPFGVVINRDGIGDERVDRYCESEGITVLLRIPYDERIARSYSEGIGLLDAMPAMRKHMRELLDTLCGFKGREVQ